MKNFVSLLIILFSALSFAQKEFHVFPSDGNNIVGSPNGDGSINNPWDLQTALQQSSKRVNGGDIIWIHEGIYNGRFKSVLKSTNSDFITVSAYKQDRVVLNGNVGSKGGAVLDVNSTNVIFRNFEVTFLGEYSRLYSDENYYTASGINHRAGECKFQNLIIYNIPGLGFGSWKLTGGSVIEDCIIYNNGTMEEPRGSGEGMYVQNKSDDLRIIRNNIIFNNYYKGIEVWSASAGHDYEFVKNVELSDNILFNNGMPSGTLRDNVIIATNDTKGINKARDIQVKNNVFYHNIDFSDSKNYGYGTALAIGFKARALVENITITDNILLGRNNPLNLMHFKSLTFKNNKVYGSYVNFDKSSLPALNSGLLDFDNNEYYTRKNSGFRIVKYKDYNLQDWQQTFGVDKNSSMKRFKDFEINPVLKVTPLHTNSSHFNVALIDKNGNDVEVDFSAFHIKEGTPYKIYDIENRKEILKAGRLLKGGKIKFPLNSKAFEKPLHNTVATKSANNFGVFRIEFEALEKKSALERFFDWLF
ncbi:hypothetical protein DFQ11_10783 [Winogradskyella epiphytica]|uniref:Parallel beta helix pectate lyase-like protein n=1 Tax=Winogradskyella epiphytica TaxID=262005 RepID=A0A2V4YAS5_9FLAO|nr:hypothetical protein [Winogradskyella epiphytica]PYE80113.1 hypothetical protein DFQ11_10783 [Winogradskyella epiphytica]GGW71511.1 hypothetical protein GCM10008085_24450 [Winogradskyella epiphytica]